MAKALEVFHFNWQNARFLDSIWHVHERDIIVEPRVHACHMNSYLSISRMNSYLSTRFCPLRASIVHTCGLSNFRSRLLLIPACNNILIFTAA